MDNEKKVFTVEEVAKIAGVPKLTIYRNVAKGSVPATRLGSRVLIPGSFVRQMTGESK